VASLRSLAGVNKTGHSTRFEQDIMDSAVVPGSRNTLLRVLMQRYWGDIISNPF
jgi:hypothetical protein